MIESLPMDLPTARAFGSPPNITQKTDETRDRDPRLTAPLTPHLCGASSVGWGHVGAGFVLNPVLSMRAFPIPGRTKFGESARRLCALCCGFAVISACPKDEIDREFALS